MFLKKVRFYGEELLAPRPTPKLDEKLLSAVRSSLFIVFIPTLHIGGHSSIHILRACHAVVTGPNYHCVDRRITLRQIFRELDLGV